MVVYGELGQLPVNLWWKEGILKLGFILPVMLLHSQSSERNTQNTNDQFIQRWHANLELEHSLTGQGGNKRTLYRLTLGAHVAHAQRGPTV